ncbi:MAG: SDR family NAD(P)-dependent oxidoreductase, partial [Gammaproteobacteria bacterium]|nr:SDR family NAD(P)-dependent oxidoreductase [Gammaproteobacteria bacterium]
MDNRTLPDGYQPNIDLLADQVILVTGAGDGIGRAAAVTYARYGATVILLGRTVSKLEAVYDHIVSMDRQEPAIIPADISTLGIKTLN